jgi:hypothetical protein
MTVNFLYSQTIATAILPVFRPFEIFILLHTINEGLGYDGR